MFERFSSQFHVTYQLPHSPASNELVPPQMGRIAGLEAFMARYQGATFERGLYRVHTLEGCRKWTTLVGQAFPSQASRLWCFAYDWLGRQFALDSARRQNREPLLLLLEVDMGQASQIPCTFVDFHEKELVDDSEAALLPSVFQEWMDQGHAPLQPHECVGYKVPLFLGGADELENFEVTDMEVYWGLCAQLHP